MPKFIIKINTPQEQIADNSDICCFVLNTSLGEEFITSFDSGEKQVLLSGENSAELCKKLDLDGVYLDINPEIPTKQQVLPVRDILGKRRVIGTLINPSRHAAMLVSEFEPEFVAFRHSGFKEDSATDIIQWYNELFLIQSAVDYGDNYGGFADVAADFVIISAQDYKILVAKNKSLD